MMVRGFVRSGSIEASNNVNQTNTFQQADLTVLKVGAKFKSSQHLIREMKMKKYKTGSNGHKAQMKFISSVCKWTYGLDENGKKISNEITILECYDNVVTTVDRRKVRKDTKLSRLVSKSILDMLKRNQSNEDTAFGVASSFCISKRDLMNELGLKNSSYDSCRRAKASLAEYLSIPLNQVEDFFELTDDVIRKTIDSACKSLKNQRCAITKETKQLFFDTEMLEIGSELVTNSTFATDEQLRFIFSAEGMVLSRYGYKSIAQVFKQNDVIRQRYYKDVIELIRTTAPDTTPEMIQLKRLSYYCSAYEMCYFQERVNAVIEMNGSLTSEERVELGDFVLEEFVKNLEIGLNSTTDDVNLEMAKRSKTNALRNHTIALKDDKKPSCRKDETYADNMETLVNVLISKQNPVDVNELKSQKRELG